MAQFESDRISEKISKSRSSQTINSKNGKICSNCGHMNPEEALFCGECGSPLQLRNCPGCGKPMHHPDGDICEYCGAWTLTGKCCICYSEISPDMAYCPECGNPTNGIPCPKCGTVSFTDYCRNCHTCLTEQAAELSAELQNMPEQKQYVDACKEQESIEEQIVQLEKLLCEESQEEEKSDKDEETRILCNLKELAARREKKKQSKVGFTDNSESCKPHNEVSKPKVSARNQDTSKLEEIKKRKEKLCKLKNEQEAIREKISNPPPMPDNLKTNQEVRRYFMAIKPPRYKGWLCNAYSVIHEDPIHCERPQDGGRWLTE